MTAHFTRYDRKPCSSAPEWPGPGQAAAAETGGLQPEVAAVLLHHHVGRDLRRAEHAVHARVDAHRFVDAVAAERMTVVDGPARLELDERQPVRRVAVDLVGAREDERRVGAVPPRHFEQDRACRWR